MTKAETAPESGKSERLRYLAKKSYWGLIGAGALSWALLAYDRISTTDTPSAEEKVETIIKTAPSTIICIIKDESGNTVEVEVDLNNRQQTPNDVAVLLAGENSLAVLTEATGEYNEFVNGTLAVMPNNPPLLVDATDGVSPIEEWGVKYFIVDGFMEAES